MRLGHWQKEVLADCAEEPGTPLRDLRGRAKNWSSQYYRSLCSLRDQGLLERKPLGPQGGQRWVTTEKGKAAVGV